MDNSTHRVEVIKIDNIEIHPNADRLEIIKVFDGYTCCVAKGDYRTGDLAAYIPPDSIVPETEQFAFLNGHRRIKVKRLRGVISMGLLIHAPEGSVEGDNVAELLGIVHYEPEIHGGMSTSGETEKPPPGYHPHYDLDSLRRYARLFNEGELVHVTEKIHGAQGRFFFDGERFHCGSKKEWKKYDPGNMWWRALFYTPDGKEIQDFLVANPSITVYGEVYGQVQDLKYNTQPGELRIAVFDLHAGDKYIDSLEARSLGSNLPWVPNIAFNIPFNLEWCLSMAEGDSLVEGANHVREGCVIKPIHERYADRFGRLCLKVVGNGYLER